MSSPIARRRLLLGALAALGATACSPSPSPSLSPDAAPPPAARPPSSSSPSSSTAGEGTPRSPAGADAQGTAAPPRDPAEAARIEELALGLDALAKELREGGEVRRSQTLPAPGSGGLAGEDLAARVRARLQADPEIPHMLLQDVEAAGGSLTIRGRVGTLEQLQRVLLAALHLPDARVVTCRVAVEPDDGAGASKAGASGE